MGSSPSSQNRVYSPDVRRVAADGFATPREPVFERPRNPHPGGAAVYAVPVMVPARFPTPLLQPSHSVTPVVQFSRQDSWSESRDLTFCRILGAEEFLGRMLEQDELLRQLSQRDDREQMTPQIVETLGLRGHLQGELVRIERMLAESDPELKNIANYEISNAAVVEILREIRDEAKRLRDSEIQTEAEEGSQANRKSLGTETTEQAVGPSTTDQGVETDDGKGGMVGLVGVSGYSSIEAGRSIGADGRGDGRSTGVDVELQSGVESRGVAVGMDGFEKIDRLRDVATETDLQELHKQEELELAERFAQRIAGGPRQLSSDDVNRVLGEHAKSVQALKRRHDIDREKLLQRLEQRKTELKRCNDNSDDDNDNDDDKHVRRGMMNGDREGSRNELCELIDENSRTMEELRRVKDLEKQRVQEMLERKRKGLMNVVSEEDDRGSHDQSRSNPKNAGNERTSLNTSTSLQRETSGNDPSLDEVVRTLESMRLRGELSQETMTSTLGRYMSRMNGSSKEEEEDGPQRKTKHKRKHLTQDEDATRDAVQRLVEDNQLNMEAIQKQRLIEKELIERKLQLKLNIANHGSPKAS